ncbi:TIGR01906 family membrane protein [Arthrobacter sp. APC 3897]|uniref:TIGR01906 family membrane protein n=1 Tax=Arthrobacter sp. APC 3897 TaxID=3035204 RepID=UPI0025B4BE8A|nr:TIGR01906 family membrane protein [Arthrobacter sp. APC 3897]MDN3480754.1 TIGR01906 family membrane protein [Arthrobacter sp. APC 3897]
MASQDDTPQQHPTPGGSAEPEKHRTDQAAEESSRLSDASETIVSGDHAAGSGTGAAADGGAAGTADTAGSPASPDSDADRRNPELDHDDWEAAFAEAAGTPSADVVPGGHPSLAQRSTLPMRRAGTMPNVSGYGDLSDEEREQAGRIDAEVPSAGTTAAADSSGAPAGDEGSDGLPKTAPVSSGTASAPHLRDSSAERDQPEEPVQEPVPATPGQETALMSETAVTAEKAVPAEKTATSETASDRNPDKGLGPADRRSEPAAAPGTYSAAEDASGSAAAGTPTAAIPAVGVAAAGTSGSDGKSGVPADRPAEDEISEEEIRRRAEERERAGAVKPTLARILQVMIAVFFPVMLLAAAIRAVATPLFLWIEYHRPGFPADSYGFSTDDRMTYGSYAVDYLLNFSGARYLGDLVTASGEPLYLESEVGHMADVKTVLTVAFVTALAMAVLSLLACIYLAKRSPGGIRRALFSGAVVTLVLVGALVVTAVLGWESFFTQVHTIFFANGNWTFRMDDTLIRLFPAQFWMDAGIAIAGLVLLTCLVVLIASWPTKARRQRSRRKQEEARRRYLESLEAV